nr:keratin-associated protein 19-2-like [Bactrocera oleae]
MKFIAALCVALILLVVLCHAAPVERETLLSIEDSQPVVIAFEEQPQPLTRVARGFGGYGGYPGYGGFGGGPGYGGFGGRPGYGGFGGGPGYGGFGRGPGFGGYGGFPGYGGGYSSSSATANANSGSYFG